MKFFEAMSSMSPTQWHRVQAVSAKALTIRIDKALRDLYGEMAHIEWQHSGIFHQCVVRVVATKHVWATFTYKEITNEPGYSASNRHQEAQNRVGASAKRKSNSKKVVLANT